MKTEVKGKMAVSILLLALAFVVFRPVACTAEEVKISGTGGGLAAIRILAEIFNRTYPDLQVKVLPIIGSTGGIRAVTAGSLDLAVSGRPLRSEERSAGATEIPYAKTPFVFGVHHTVTISGLSLKEAVDLYRGTPTTWPDGTPVRLVLRHKGESDLLILKGLSEEMSAAVDHALEREGMIVASTDVDNADILENTPGTLGTTNLSLILSEKRRIRVLPFGGVDPTVKSLSDGSYPYAKLFYFVVGKTVTPATRKFIEFVFSPKGVSVLERTGHVVIPR